MIDNTKPVESGETPQEEHRPIEPLAEAVDLGEAGTAGAGDGGMEQVAEEEGGCGGGGGCAGCGSGCSSEGAEGFESGGEHSDESADVDENDEGAALLCVRYGRMAQLALFRSKLGRLPYHSKVVIKSDRGLEIGTVLCAGNKQMTYEDRPLRVMGAARRVATHDDLMEDRHLQQSAVRERKFCEERIRARKLPMKLAEVEHLFGGDRIIFYFLSDGRVDFRDLVRDLAQEYQTRIEMRQIGVRDEARLMADYERCGQFICCRAFIKEFKPVTMRMAKVQKATLDPSKISGRCGRLMCCLRYENETYNDLKERLPRRNSYVRTAEGVGKVIGGDIMTQLVKVGMLEKVHVVPVDELLQRNVPEAEFLAEQQAMLEARQRRFTPRGPRPDRPRRDRVAEPSQAAPGAATAAVAEEPMVIAEPVGLGVDTVDVPVVDEEIAEVGGRGDASSSSAGSHGSAGAPGSPGSASTSAPAGGEAGRDSASRRRRQRRKRRKQSAATGATGTGADGSAGDEGGDSQPEQAVGAGGDAGSGGDASADAGSAESAHHRQSRRDRERHSRREASKPESGGPATVAGAGGGSGGRRDLSVPRAVLESYGLDAEFLDDDKAADDDVGNRAESPASGVAGGGGQPAGASADRQKRRRRRRRKPRSGGGEGSSGGAPSAGSEG